MAFVRLENKCWLFPKEMREMRERIAEDAKKFCELLEIATEDPTILFDLVNDMQAKLELHKNVCRDMIITKKKEEYFQTLIQNKNLGIRK